MPIARDTGFPGSDAQDDFLRARRGRMLARLSSMSSATAITAATS